MFFFEPTFGTEKYLFTYINIYVRPGAHWNQVVLYFLNHRLVPRYETE
uniref:Uncharacterized protein n=1 Tax=viral metagenome TaxID=1070528 RepID=A0A6C0AE45_9ZZZZ